LSFVPNREGFRAEINLKAGAFLPRPSGRGLPRHLINLDLLSGSAMFCREVACAFLGDEDGHAGESAPWKAFYKVQPDGSIVLYAEDAANGGFDSMARTPNVNGSLVFSWHAQPVRMGQGLWGESLGGERPGYAPFDRAAW
jgi:hypothetical protein